MCRNRLTCSSSALGLGGFLILCVYGDTNYSLVTSESASEWSGQGHLLPWYSRGEFGRGKTWRLTWAHGTGPSGWSCPLTCSLDWSPAGRAGQLSTPPQWPRSWGSWFATGTACWQCPGTTRCHSGGRRCDALRRSVPGGPPPRTSPGGCPWWGQQEVGLPLAPQRPHRPHHPVGDPLPEAGWWK